ncbi:hypothetical protein Nmel_018113 [Mimus melanotis]
MISGTALVFPLNSRQAVTSILPPEPQKPANHRAGIKRQEKQFAIAQDDLVLADPQAHPHLQNPDP